MMVWYRCVLLVSLLSGFGFFICACGGPSRQVSIEKASAANTEARPAIKKAPDILQTSLAEFSPYFSRYGDGEAALALSEDRLADALPLFVDIAEYTSDIVLTPRARFIVGYISEIIGEDEKALASLKAAGEDLPLVADLAFERAARAALRLGKCEEAVALSLRVSKEGTYAPDAYLTRADALRLSGKFSESIDAYRTYLQNWPSGYRHQEAKARIVSAAAALDKAGVLTAETADEAFRVLQTLQAANPQGYWTRQAEDHEETLLKKLGRTVQREQPARKAALKAYESASGLKQRMQNEAAEKEYDRVIRLAKNNTSLRCLARLEQAIVVQQQRDFGRAATLYEGVAKDCDDPNIQIRSLYRGAKAYDASGNEEDAVRLFAEVERTFPHHSYADDARLRGARAQLSLGHRETFKEMLSTLPDVYPDGDMRGEALWTLCYDALSRGELTDARDALVKYFKYFPKERGWYVAGRSGYWLARVNELLGDAVSARAYYEQVIASAPLTYYMVLAYNRLAKMDDARAEMLLDTLAPEGGTANMMFERSLIDEYPGLATGIELHRLGLVTSAKREFDNLLDSAELPAEVYWIISAFQRRWGNYADAKDTAAKDDQWKDRYPVNRDLVPWTLAYPTVFEEEVEHASETSNVSPFLIWAVMREESGFDTRIESWANAMGLMQLILPTARSMGKQLGIKVNRKSLRKPDVNIPLGTAYLSYLNGHFGGHPALTVAGYNAGEGAVGRWLKDNSGTDVDVFVEQIPYEQTRGYTKRVISTYATYMFLYDEKRRILDLPLTLP